jgi:hypothetical protein
MDGRSRACCRASGVVRVAGAIDRAAVLFALILVVTAVIRL